MSSTDDNSLPGGAGASTGRSLALIAHEPAASANASPGASSAKPTHPGGGWRWIAPAALIVLTGGVGWFAGAHSSLSASVGSRTSIESSIASELLAQSAMLAALDARLKSLESAPGPEASLKPAIEILAQRIDEIARKQTAAITQTSTRLDRSEKDLAARIDRLGERMERIEKQVSSAVPTGSVQKNVTAVTRSAPESEDRAREANEKSVRGYVLRDVFRGGALVESRYGLMEVFPGAQLPGAGRVRSVEKRDGRWVVVTTTGLIETSR